jgi:hypothetical protein
VRGTPVRPATDVFALGQLCVFAASGHAAFGEGPTEAVFYRIAYEEPQLDDCPEALRVIAARCLAKDPAERPTVEEIIGLARAETAGETMRLAEGWLPPAVAATFVAYDPKAVRGASVTEVVRPVPYAPVAPSVVRQPTLVAPTGPTPAPGGGVSVPSVVALTALVAAAVLLAVVVGARLLSGGGSTATASPVSTSSPLDGSVVTPTSTTTVRPAPARSSVTVTAAPSGYVAYSEAGWAIELPSGWVRRLKAGDTSGSVFWYAPDGVSYLQVDPQPWGSGGALVQARKADSVASRNTSRFPGYQLTGITPVSYQDDAADWDFTFDDATGAGPVHGRDRFFQASGRPFAIYLRALDGHWPDYQDALAQAYAGFRLQ